jgi:hypothetical protein
VCHRITNVNKICLKLLPVFGWMKNRTRPINIFIILFGCWFTTSLSRVIPTNAAYGVDLRMDNVSVDSAGNGRLSILASRIHRIRGLMLPTHNLVYSLRNGFPGEANR